MICNYIFGCIRNATIEMISQAQYMQTVEGGIVWRAKCASVPKWCTEWKIMLIISDFWIPKINFLALASIILYTQINQTWSDVISIVLKIVFKITNYLVHRWKTGSVQIKCTDFPSGLFDCRLCSLKFFDFTSKVFQGHLWFKKRQNVAENVYMLWAS